MRYEPRFNDYADGFWRILDRNSGGFIAGTWINESDAALRAAELNDRDEAIALLRCLTGWGESVVRDFTPVQAAGGTSVPTEHIKDARTFLSRLDAGKE